MGYVLGVSEPALQTALSEHLHPGDVLYDIGAHGEIRTTGSRGQFTGRAHLRLWALGPRQVVSRGC